MLSVPLLSAAGARGACMVALAVFTLGSVACAAAPSMPWMLAGRSVQGLGGGTLAALSYALIRIVFAPPLWPRAVALVSGMWGVATVCGPAVGGLFAQALVVAIKLRPASSRGAAIDRQTGIPLVQVTLLTASVLAVAAGSPSSVLVVQGVSVAAAIALGAVYASIALLLIGTTTEIFDPYFLQNLHGHTPMASGYLTAAMAAGWSVSSLASSGCEGDRAERLLQAGPMLCTAGLLALAVLMPSGAGLSAGVFTATCSVALACVGAGVGIRWPHLVTRVLTLAPPGETGTASAAITTVQLYGMAIGAAVAGLFANAAGLIRPGGTAGARSAALWLFASFALAPVIAALLARLITRRQGIQ